MATEDSISTPARAGAAPGRSGAASWLLPVLTGVGGVLIGVVLTLSAIVITGFVGAASKSTVLAATPSPSTDDRDQLLSSALVACSIEDGDDASIADQGFTLTVNSKGNDDASGITLTDLACLQTELKTPQAVISHLDQTTSLDGRQTETGGLITESWSYHPDRGLDAVFTVEHQS